MGNSETNDFDLLCRWIREGLTPTEYDYVPPSKELMKAVRDSTEKARLRIVDLHQYSEEFQLLAAADDRDVPRYIVTPSGAFSIEWENRPGDQTNTYMIVTCLIESRRPDCVGRRLLIEIGGQELLTSKFDHGGVAELVVPRDLDFTKTIKLTEIE